MSSRQPAVVVTHPAPNTHTMTIHTPSPPHVNTNDPKVQGYIIGASAATAIGALGFGLYKLWQYYSVRNTQYKLVYFNGRGLAEVPRYLFALAGVDYIDQRFTDVPNPDDPKQPRRPEFEANKESYPFGQVPVLVVGGDNGIVLSQSKAIERYLARNFCYMGCGALEQQLVETVGEAIRDSRDAFMKVRDTPDKPKFFTDHLPKQCRYLNRFATQHGTSADHSTFVGSKLSLADVQWFHFLSMFDDQEAVNRALAPYPALKAIRANVANQPAIQKWIATRPNTPF